MPCALGPIRFITVHCSGSPAGRGDTAKDVCAWDIKRFNQPSYHFVIDEKGKVTPCLSLNELGCHVALHNHGNIGVCYVGGVRDGKNVDTRTVNQRIALRHLIDTLKERYPAAIVRGHRDWPNVHKDCPCFDVATAL